MERNIRPITLARARTGEPLAPAEGGLQCPKTKILWSLFKRA